MMDLQLDWHLSHCAGWEFYRFYKLDKPIKNETTKDETIWTTNRSILKKVLKKVLKVLKKVFKEVPKDMDVSRLEKHGLLPASIISSSDSRHTKTYCSKAILHWLSRSNDGNTADLMAKLNAPIDTIRNRSFDIRSIERQFWRHTN